MIKVLGGNDVFYNVSINITLYTVSDTLPLWVCTHSLAVNFSMNFEMNITYIFTKELELELVLFLIHSELMLGSR